MFPFFIHVRDATPAGAWHGGRLRRCAAAVLAAAALMGSLHAAPPAASGTGSGLSPYKQLSLAELMDIEVTSVSRRPEMLSEVASALQVLTSEEIRRAGATGVPSALRLLPNLHVARIDSRQWAIAARGFNNTITNKLLVLLDGRTLYTPLFSGVFWDVQDTLMEDVDRIETVSGPGATQWGSNAVNGVINITTKHARDTQGGLLKGKAGTELRTAGAARYGGTIAPGLFYRVYGKYTEWDNSITTAGESARDAWDMTQGGFRVDWDRSTADHFTLQGDLYKGEFGQATDRDIRVDGTNVIGRWTRILETGAEAAVQYYYDYTHRTIPGSITQNLEIHDLDFQHRTTLATRHHLVWGASYRHIDDRIKNPFVLAFIPADVSREWVSGFLQDEMSVADDRLRLTAGVKVERNPYTGTEYQPSVRAAWKWRERQLLWAAFSRALRTPSRIDRELFLPAAPPHAIAGGPDFTSEKLLAYELGYRAEPGPGLAFSVATFFHDYDDLRSLEPADTPGGPAQLANGITGKSYGVEWSGTYRPAEKWRLRLGYTEQRVTSELKPGSRDTARVGSPILDPDRYAVLTSQYDFSTSVSFDVSTRYVGRIANHKVPSYAEMDVRLSWRARDDLELAVVGRNLLDRSHPEFGAPETRREVERNVHGSFTWRF
jgi:iron complex outermembrane recepter protein